LDIITSNIILYAKWITASNNTPPNISLDPLAHTVCVGQPDSFFITASGSGILTYQWQKNGSALTGKTNSVLKFTSAAITDTGSYTCYVTNEGGKVTSNSAKLTVNIPSTASTGVSASSTSVCTGSSTSLSVIGGNLGTDGIWKWYTDQNCSTPVPGTNSGSPLTVAPTIATTYYVRAEGSCGNTATASVALSINPSPVISSSPASRSVSTGSMFNLNVTAVPDGNGFRYQWKLNGASLTNNSIYYGVDQFTLEISNATQSQSGTYTCEVMNAYFCTTTSTPAVITVTSP
jgi:hypothetical protein